MYGDRLFKQVHFLQLLQQALPQGVVKVSVQVCPEEQLEKYPSSEQVLAVPAE